MYLNYPSKDPIELPYTDFGGIMYSNSDQREILSSIKVRENSSTRIDCPFCGGKKTFTISNLDGKRIWNCYKAACGSRGAESSDMSTGAMRRRLGGVAATRERKTQPIPSMLSDPRSHEECLEYLHSVNSFEAFDTGLIHVRYLPAQRRALFFNEDHSGAVGRSLSGERPKWKVFGAIDGIMQVGSGRTAVVVEDIASACSVSRLPEFCGCALLGTNLSYLQRQQLGLFDTLVIALDSDASRKALKLQSSLAGRINCKVLLLDDDLKYLNISQIRRLFKI